jgi:hypothetical protein
MKNIMFLKLSISILLSFNALNLKIKTLYVQINKLYFKAVSNCQASNCKNGNENLHTKYRLCLYM